MIVKSELTMIVMYDEMRNGVVREQEERLILGVKNAIWHMIGKKKEEWWYLVLLYREVRAGGIAWPKIIKFFLSFTGTTYRFVLCTCQQLVSFESFERQSLEDLREQE